MRHYQCGICGELTEHPSLHDCGSEVVTRAELQRLRAIEKAALNLTNAAEECEFEDVIHMVVSLPLYHRLEEALEAK